MTRSDTQLPLQWRLNSPNAPKQPLDRFDKLAQQAQAAARAQGREVSFTAWPDVVSLVEQLATEAPRQVEAALEAKYQPFVTRGHPQAQAPSAGLSFL